MNLLMCAPLLDNRGKTRYFIGAQVDVSDLCKDATDLPGLQRLLAKEERHEHDHNSLADTGEEGEKDSFQELVEMFNETELVIVRQYGGKMHREQVDENEDTLGQHDQSRLLIKEPSDPATFPKLASTLTSRNGKVEGIYRNVSTTHGEQVREG
jgi:hypothetical protein